MSFCRVNKALLSTFIEGLSFYMMEMRKKMDLTCKTNMCEKVKLAVGDCSGKVCNLSCIVLCYKLSDDFIRVFNVFNYAPYSG